MKNLKVVVSFLLISLSFHSFSQETRYRAKWAQEIKSQDAVFQMAHSNGLYILFRDSESFKYKDQSIEDDKPFQVLANIGKDGELLWSLKLEKANETTWGLFFFDVDVEDNIYFQISKGQKYLVNDTLVIDSENESGILMINPRADKLNFNELNATLSFQSKSSLKRNHRGLIFDIQDTVSNLYHKVHYFEGEFIDTIFTSDTSFNAFNPSEAKYDYNEQNGVFSWVFNLSHFSNDLVINDTITIPAPIDVDANRKLVTLAIEDQEMKVISVMECVAFLGYQVSVMDSELLVSTNFNAADAELIINDSVVAEFTYNPFLSVSSFDFNGNLKWFSRAEENLSGSYFLNYKFLGKQGNDILFGGSVNIDNNNPDAGFKWGDFEITGIDFYLIRMNTLNQKPEWIYRSIETSNPAISSLTSSLSIIGETDFMFLNNLPQGLGLTIDTFSFSSLGEKSVIIAYADTSTIKDVSIPENDPKSFSIFPNPTRSTLSINGVKGPVYIYNGLGQLVYKKRKSELLQIIDVESWNSGVYLIKANGNFRKVLVQ